MLNPLGVFDPRTLGGPVKNREALANPEALDLFADLAELRS